MSTFKSITLKYRSLIIFIVGLIIVFCLLYALRSVILPFIVGIALAYLFHPLIVWLEKKLPKKTRYKGLKRVLLIVAIYIVLIGFIALISYYVVMAIVNAAVVLFQNAPSYISSALYSLQQFTIGLSSQFPDEIQKQITEFLVNAGIQLTSALQTTVSKGVAAIPRSFSAILGFAALPIFLFYMLKDWEKLSRGLSYNLEPLMSEHVRSIMNIIDSILGRYIRAQLLLSFIVGYLCFMGLLILRVPFAPALGVFAGLTELVPVVGPWLGGAAAVIVTLAVAPSKALWVALVFVVVQLLENNLLVPRVQASYLKMHPAVVLFLLVVGAYIAGFWGLIFIVPVVATIAEIYRYIRTLASQAEVEEPEKVPDT